MSQPRISKQNSWQKHEERVREAIALALTILRTDAGLARLHDELNSKEKRSIEDRINRALFFCLNKANRTLQRSRRGVGRVVRPPV